MVQCTVLKKQCRQAAAAESPRSPNDPRGQVQQAANLNVCNSDLCQMGLCEDLANQGSAEELSTEASTNSKDG